MAHTMSLDTLLIYTTVSFFYIISPGPAIFLAIANGMTGQIKAVLASTLGNIIGLFILSAISMIGLGSIILASATLFFITKIVGASYLIYLGIKQFKASKASRPSNFQAQHVKNKRLNSYFIEGFLLAISNPKPILFFIAIFPQFININHSLMNQFFALTGIFMVLSFLSLMLYGVLGKKSKKLFQSPSGMAWFHRVTGGLFVFMGVALLKLKTSSI